MRAIALYFEPVLCRFVIKYEHGFTKRSQNAVEIIPLLWYNISTEKENKTHDKEGKTMKWIKNDVKFERGNYECLIAQYDNNGTWYVNRADMITQQAAKKNFKMFGEFLGASVCEVKRYWDDDNDEAAENNIIIFDGRGFDGEKCETYVLWREREGESLERIGELKRK